MVLPIVNSWYPEPGVSPGPGGLPLTPLGAALIGANDPPIVPPSSETPDAPTLPVTADFPAGVGTDASIQADALIPVGAPPPMTNIMPVRGAEVRWQSRGASFSRAQSALAMTVPPTLIAPTIYPAPPGDTVTVEDAVSIDVRSAEFHEFKEKIGRLCAAIEQSNEVSREVGDKLVAELQAGLKIIEAPKPSRKLIMILLMHPLGATATIFAGGLVAELGKHAADLLLKLIGAG
jgi:hypothetical protein